MVLASICHDTNVSCWHLKQQRSVVDRKVDAISSEIMMR
jgi:hypothetical protein